MSAEQVSLRSCQRSIHLLDGEAHVYKRVSNAVDVRKVSCQARRGRSQNRLQRSLLRRSLGAYRPQSGCQLVEAGQQAVSDSFNLSQVLSECLSSSYQVWLAGRRASLRPASGLSSVASSSAASAAGLGSPPSALMQAEPPSRASLQKKGPGRVRRLRTLRA